MEIFFRPGPPGCACWCLIQLLSMSDLFIHMQHVKRLHLRLFEQKSPLKKQRHLPELNVLMLLDAPALPVPPPGGLPDSNRTRSSTRSSIRNSTRSRGTRCLERKTLEFRRDSWCLRFVDGPLLFGRSRCFYCCPQKVNVLIP